jgi:predicted metalloprotease with PDZ domain
MLHYHISYEYPCQHFVDIVLRIEQVQAAQIEVQLPAWRPGRYELAHYAKNIQKFTVKDAQGQSLPFRKLRKDRWQIDCAGQSSLEIHYNYYAHQLDAGGSWLDEEQLYLNFVNCLLYVEGRQEEACQVHLQLPEQYQVACGLPQVAKHLLQAENYAHLADSPMMASASLQHRSYEVEGLPFHIWIQGDWKPDWDSLLNEFTRFTQNQIQTFGDFPEKDYHFLLQILPYKFYHGVEHRNSTVIALGPSEQLYGEELYQELLSISSHELYHAWNICKIRPQELVPYDYTQENYFRSGFVVEGITSYMGDLFLVRSGVWKYQLYIKELNKYLKRHFDNFGRYNYSLSESSFDLWLDGYGTGIPNRKVSIYAKGAVVALMLDLQIRLLTQNAASLDDLMRRLWVDFGKANQGYSMADVQRLAEEVAGASLQSFFEDFVHGTCPLEEPLAALLENFGFSLIINYINTGTETFSFQTQNQGDRILVSMIVPDSNASKVLALGDELVAVDGRKIEGNLHALLSGESSIELSLFRHKKLRNITIEADQKQYFCEYYLQIKNDLSKEQQENLNAWLNG